MRFLRSILAPVTAVALLLSTTAAPIRQARADASATFPDLKGHWAEATVMQAVAAGFVSGYPDGTFQPDQSITRAEYVAMLVKAGHLTNPAVGQFGWFRDMGGHWLNNQHMLQNAIGLISPFDYGDYFNPDQVIPRQELAILAERLLGRIARAQSLTGTDVAFADKGDIPGWARGYIKLAVDDRILNGYPDGTFRPSQGATRAEAVTMVQHAVTTMEQGLDPNLTLIVGGHAVVPTVPLLVRAGYVYVPLRWAYGLVHPWMSYRVNSDSSVTLQFQPSNGVFVTFTPQLEVPVGGNTWSQATSLADGAARQSPLLADTLLVHGELMVPAAPVGGDGTLPYADAHSDAVHHTLTINVHADWPANSLPSSYDQAMLTWSTAPPAKLPPGAWVSLPAFHVTDSAGRWLSPLGDVRWHCWVDPASPLSIRGHFGSSTDLILSGDYPSYLWVDRQASAGTYTVNCGATGFAPVTWTLQVDPTAPLPAQ